MITPSPYAELADLLPKLAINLGWLRLIDEVHCEQTRLQHKAAKDAATQKAVRREGRKRARQKQHLGFIAAIRAA